MNDLAKMRANESRLLVKKSQSLLGICAGMMADGTLNEHEVRFLDLWLREHEACASAWPGNVILEQVRAVLREKVINEIELKQLQGILVSLLGGTWVQTGAVEGLPTSLPVQADAVVEIPGNSFCFTGKFAFGTRAACENAVVENGGHAVANVIKTLDFLVIGTFVTPDWLETSYGRKIEKAVTYRNEGCGIQIVSEKVWRAAIQD